MLSAEEKSKVDEALVDFNETLRSIREMGSGVSPVSIHQIELAKIVSQVNEEKIKPYVGLRRFARLVRDMADRAEACEKTRQSDEEYCPCGVLMVNMIVAPVTIVMNCVHAGFEIARGKDMP